MSANLTINHQNTQEEHDNSEDSFNISEVKLDRKKKSFTKALNENSGSKSLSDKEHRFLIIIGKYDYGSGVCFASTRTIAKDNPCMTERSISRTITSLKRKGFLFSHQVHYKNRRGSYHLMVREEGTLLAHNTFIKQKRLEVAEELKEYFNLDAPIEEVTYQNMVTDHLPKYGNSITPSVLDKKKNVRRINTPSLLSQLEEEFRRSKLTPQQIEEGLKYFKHNEEKVMKAHNPIAYLISMVKEGWAQDELNKLEEKEQQQVQAKLDEDRRGVVTRENIKRVQGLQKASDQENENHPGDIEHQSRVLVNEHGFSFSLGRLSCIVCGYSDKNFMQVLEKCYSKINLCAVSI